MAEVDIGDLTPQGTLLATALIEIEQAGATFSATIQQVLDLAGSASQTPWTSNISGDGFHLQDLGAMEFRDPVGTPPAGTVFAIYTEAAGMVFNVAASNNFAFSVNNVDQMLISDTTINFQANTLTNILDITTITSLNGVVIGNYALTTGTLAQFAATTSLQLLGVISDETGTGLLVFNSSPTIITPTIASFANATHSHLNAAGGGTITKAWYGLVSLVYICAAMYGGSPCAFGI